MFKIQQKQFKQNDDIWQHSMKRVGIRVQKSEYPKLKLFTKYYDKNYKDLGIVISPQQSKLTEDQEYYYYQLLDVFQEPISIHYVPFDDGIDFVYYFTKYKMFKKEDISKFLQDVKNLQIE